MPIVINCHTTPQASFLPGKSFTNGILCFALKRLCIAAVSAGTALALHGLCQRGQLLTPCPRHKAANSTAYSSMYAYQNILKSPSLTQRDSAECSSPFLLCRCSPERPFRLTSLENRVSSAHLLLQGRSVLKSYSAFGDLWAASRRRRDDFRPATGDKPGAGNDTGASRLLL